MSSQSRRPQAGGLSARALATPEPFVRLFARRVQQEGALDLTQGDYKNADFAPHPEVVRAAQRITRNTVHSYGPAVGRMDVRSEVAEFFNRDGLLDYPDSEVRFQPDEVLFTPGTRAGLAIVLEVLGADGSGVVVPRPSWEYDWFIERAGKKVVELPTAAPEFLPDPKELDRLLARGGISSVIINNPHNPTGRVYPRELVEELVRVAVKHRCYVLYDSVYQRLDYVGWFVNPAFACPEWRDWVVSLSGLSKMDMFGASTGARACWMVISDQIRSNGVRAREILANLSAWLVATPSTLAQDWALAALQSPLAALRRPSPYMRERRDFMLRAADELAHLGIERTDFGGTFYAPLAFPGLIGEPFDRLRNGVHEKAVVRDSVDAFELLLSGGVGGIPFVAFAGSTAGGERYGTWQRLSYGSKDVKELAVFMDRVKARIEQQGRLGAAAATPVPPRADAALDEVWQSVCTAGRYDALDALDLAAFNAARQRFLEQPRHESLRLTGTKHPDSTAHRAEQVARALRAAPAGAPDRAHIALTHLEWNPLMEARLEYEESIADLLGPCSETLLDLEGRQISPDWLDVPEKVVLGLLRHGVVPGEDRHILFRVPNPFIEQDEEKIAKILAAVARSNVLFHLACERLGFEPQQNAIYEISIPQVNSSAEIGAVVKIGTLYRQAVIDLFEGPAERIDAFLAARVPQARRAAMIERVCRVRLVPLCENVGALTHLPDLAEKFYVALERGIGVDGVPTPDTFRTSFTRREATMRVFVAMSDTALQSGKIATDAACTLAVAGREEAERRLAAHAARIGEPAPIGHFPDRLGPGRVPRRLRSCAPGGGHAVRARRRRDDAGHPCRRAGGSSAAGRGVPCRSRRTQFGGPQPRRAGERRGSDRAVARGRHSRPHRDAAAGRAAARAVRQPRAADARAHPRHRLGELRPLHPHVSPRVGRRLHAARRPRPARRLARGRDPAARHRLQPRLHHARPAGGHQRHRRARPPRRGDPRAPRARLPRDHRERAAALRPRGGGPGVRQEAGGYDRATLPARRGGAVGGCAHARRSRGADVPVRDAVPALHGRGLRELGRDQGAREPDHARGGTDPRDVRAWHSRRCAPSGPATAGRCCSRWWTPRMRRACCSRASSPSRRSASSSTCASKAGCARCRRRCRTSCGRSGPRCASSARTSSSSTPSSG